MTGVLTDGQWAVLAPLIEACRPHHETQHHDLRRTTEVILWRCQDGAKWRSLPSEFGPWWMAAQTFICLRGLLAASSAKIGSSASRRMMEPVGRVGAAAGPGAGARRTAWHGLPEWQQHPGAPESGRRCSKECDGIRRPAGEALGRSRGGYRTKACVIADGSGRAVAFSLTPGQAHELPQAIGLLECLPGVSRRVVADCGTISQVFREHIWNHRPSARGR